MYSPFALYTFDTSEGYANWVDAGGTSNTKSVKKTTRFYGILQYWLRTIMSRQKVGRTLNRYCTQLIK